MKIGDEVLIRGKIVDLDNNIQGSAIRVEVLGSNAEVEVLGWQGSERKTMLRFWIHRLDQPSTVIFQKAKETIRK